MTEKGIYYNFAHSELVQKKIEIIQHFIIVKRYIFFLLKFRMRNSAEILAEILDAESRRDFSPNDACIIAGISSDILYAGFCRDFLRVSACRIL